MNQLKTAGSFTLLCIASLTIMVGTLLAIHSKVKLPAIVKTTDADELR